MNLLLRFRSTLFLLGVSLLIAAHPTHAALYPGLVPDEFMRTWLVLGPIPVGEEGQREAFAKDLLSDAGSEVRVRPNAGDTVTINGAELAWRELRSTESIVDLHPPDSREEFSVAYVWAEIEMAEPLQGVLGIGSDDGTKVWLNGELIHENRIDRAVQPDDDWVHARFQAGTNRLLLKVQNSRGAWGFACRLLGEEARAKGLFNAVLHGDLDQVKARFQQGMQIDRRAPMGLTAWQTAKLKGWSDVAEFLVEQGADTALPFPPRAEVAEALCKDRTRADGPAVAVLVSKDGKVLFQGAYGLADMDAPKPAALETQFRIGSVTKQFIGAAILRLAEEGKLTVQDKLSKFIPDYPRGEEVTVHHLLTHTSGIRSFTGKPDFMSEVTQGTTTEAHIDSFKNDPYDFDPGERWAYNNSGYFLLGYIIEKVSGRAYGDYLRDTFFAPLGMRQTGVHEASARPEHEATGYSFSNGAFKPATDWDMSKAGGAGALYSTVGDLHLWNEALFAGKVINPSSLETGFTPVPTAQNPPEGQEGGTTGYGYGWAIQEFRGAKEISHGGGLHGFLSFLFRLPEHRFTVAVLYACSPPSPTMNPIALAHDLTEIFLGNELPARQVPQVDPTVAGSALDGIPGRYDYSTAIMTVTRDGDRLFAQLTGQPRYEVFPKSPTTFFWKIVEAEVTFVKDEQGTITHALHRQGGQTIKASKLEDTPTLKIEPDLLNKYVGRYDYGGGQAIMVISREQDRLFAQMTDQPKFEIFPKSETEFVWQVIPARITFVMDEAGLVTKAVHEQGGRKFDAPRLK